MKKGLLLTAIVLWSIAAVAIGAAIIYGVRGGYNNMTTSGSLIKNETVSLGTIQNIIVEGSQQAVEIHKTSDDSIKISQYGNKKTKTEDLFIVTVTDDNVRIYFDKAWKFNFFNFINERLVIEIPEKFTGDLNAKTNSGGVKTEDEISLKNVVLKTSSGGVRINKNLIAHTLTAVTSSGGINIEGDVTLNENAIIKSSSGGLKFNGAINGKNLNAETSSGGIRAASNISIDENLELKSSSGGINIEGDIKAKNLNAETNSGGVSLGNADVETYYLKSSSGRNQFRWYSAIS